MKFRLSSIVAFMIGLAVSILVGCGGGGGAASTPDAVLEDVEVAFVDSFVAGLEVRDKRLSDGFSTIIYLSSTGSFTAKPDHEYSIKIHGQELPAINPYGPSYAKCSSWTTNPASLCYRSKSVKITPYDIVTNIAGTPDLAINTLRYLQSFDSDSDPSNGITLIDSNLTCSFSFDQSVFDFESDSCVSSRLTAANRTLVSFSSAVAHFASSVQAIGSQDTYSLNLVGKTARSSITNSKCTNGLTLGFDYSFGGQSVTATGSDQFITTGNSTVCTGGSTVNLSVDYATLSNEDAFYCLPNCTYAQLNRVWIGIDSDNRTHISSVWHTPYTKKITIHKRIILDPANLNPQAHSTFSEVITWN